MFLSEWREFPSAPCLAGKKTWWQLASRCCWNCSRPWHASKLVSFLVGLRTYQHLGIHWTPWALTSALNRLEMKLNSHLHLVQRLRLIDAVPLLHIHVHGLMLNYAQGQIYFWGKQCGSVGSVTKLGLPKSLTEVLCVHLQGAAWFGRCG